MNPEELMKPRYKVTARYPTGAFEIGDVLYQANYIGKFINDKYDQNFIYINNPENYPAIFKKLEWWEERKPEEMPKYLKTDKSWSGFDVLKVKLYFGEDREYVSFEAWDETMHQYCSEWFIPATETEYLSYLKVKTP